MTAIYETEQIKITPRFKAALIELMKAECAMMVEHQPDSAELWTWGTCELGDLANNDGLRFYYGGDDDKPKGDRFKVLSA